MTGEAVKNGTRHWIYDSVRTVWPIAVGLVFVALYFGTRLESPEQKTQRINLILEPFVVRLAGVEKMEEQRHEDHRDLVKAVRDHEKIGGHAVMEQRMAQVEATLTSITDRLERISEHLERHTESLARIEEHVNGRSP